MRKYGDEPDIVAELSKSATVLLAAMSSLRKTEHASAAYLGWANGKLADHTARIAGSVASIQRLASKPMTTGFESSAAKALARLEELDGRFHVLAAERLRDDALAMARLTSVLSKLLHGSITRRSAKVYKKDATEVVKAGVGFITVVGNILAAIEALWNIYARPDKELQGEAAFHARERDFRKAVVAAGVTLEWQRGVLATTRGTYRSHREVPTVTWAAAEKHFQARIRAVRARF